MKDDEVVPGGRRAATGWQQGIARKVLEIVELSRAGGAISQAWIA